MESNKWRRFKTWVPIVKPLPVKTFPGRFAQKVFGLLVYLFHIGLSTFGIKGARVIGTTTNGLSLLKLNRASSLGERGKLIQIPRDSVIFRSLRFFGEWEREECIFLSNALVKQGSTEKVAFVDLGANTGMITLQTLSLAKTNTSVIMVEPLPSHLECIEFNITDLKKTNLVHIFPFALGEENGNAKIFTQIQNHGNTSLIPNVIPTDELIVTEIEVRKTEDFVEEVLLGYSSYVLKSDLEGYDAVVLASIPRKIYEKTAAIVVEIWALPEIDPLHVNLCLSLWGSFNMLNWSTSPETAVSPNEVAEFWLSKSGKARGLFLTR